MKQEALKGRSIRRLVMMLARPWLYLLATPWGLWLAVKGGVILEVDFGEIRYLVKSWFAVLACPAFWLGYANDAEYRKAKSHNHMDVRQNWRISGAGAQKLTGEGREV